MQRIRIRALGAVLLPLTIAACGGGTTTSVPDAANGNTLPSTPNTATSTPPANGPDDNASLETPEIAAGNNAPVDSENTITEVIEGTDSGGEEQVPPTTVASSIIDGRVADGYLQGATICIDVNENGSCDEDEPQTISTAGGVYSLEVPLDATGKPVLADVPAEAIDEDTGEPIGKTLVFSTPGDQPSFVSPITTLVHQELKNNPSLSTTDAEATVLETLGLPDDEETSLFTDYVAESDATEESRREKFRFLHQTARVVASMLDEIRDSVETAAIDNGIDLAGDTEARKAVQKLVREEVKALLPEISAAVAERITEIRETSEFSQEAVDLTDAFDPAAVVTEVDREETPLDIVEQIDAIKNERPITQASMQELLTAGIYMLDVDCEHNDDYGDEDGLEEPVIDPVGVMLNDDGAPGIAELPEYCFANYSHVILDADNSLNMEHFYFDQSSSTWIAEHDEEFADEIPHHFVLVDGEWMPSSGDEPAGAVEFTDDGAAILSTGEGKLLVYATSRSLDGTPVLNHLVNRGAGPELSKLVTGSDLFPGDSDVYRLHIKQRQQRYVLLNWYSHDDSDGEDFCSQFDKNCNVIDVQDDNGFIPVQTLAELQEGSQDHIVISEIARDERENRPVDLQFSADSKLDTTLPVSGTVKWIVPAYHEEVSPATLPFDECYTGDIEKNSDPDFDINQQSTTDCLPPEYHPEDCVGINNEEVVTEQRLTSVNENGELLEQLFDEQVAELDFEEVPSSSKPVDFPDGPPCVQLTPDLENILSDDTPDGTTDKSDRDRTLGESRWQLINVDGQEMIEINIPVTVRHRIDIDDVNSMLLIEDGQFVRRGAHFSDRSVDDEISYSISAFETLQPVIEKYISR